ncbi:MAG: YceI family protein [Phycisphaerae bacterium]
MKLLLTAGLALAGASGWFSNALTAREAKTEQFKVDPVHSTVIYRIKHLNVSYVYGRINDIRGTFSFGDTAEANALNIEVRPESLDSHDEKRDNHLKGPDFFNVKQFPLITFKSKTVTRKDDHWYDVIGDLSFHGVTRRVTVRLNRVGSGKDPWGGYRTGFEVVFDIKRSDFGMKYLAGALGEDVRIIVAVEGIRQ